MRIAYLTQSYPPVVSGAAVVSRDLAEGMAQRGHQVLVLTASENSKSQLISKPNLIIKRFHSIRNPFRADHYFTLWPRCEIMSMLSDFAPNIIHSHDPLQFGVSALEYCQYTGVSSLLTIHQLPWLLSAYLPDWPGVKKLMEKVLWAYSCQILNRFDALITPTRCIANEVYTHTGLQTQVIGHALNPQVFYPAVLSAEQESAARKQFGLPEHVPLLLHVGRLDPEKKVDCVIHAAARAMSNSNAHLVLAGDGTEKEHLSKLCKELGIGTRSHFPGFVSREQNLPNLLRLASLFITASEIETQGLVLLEAAACGLPIVAVAATCVSDTVKDGLNGWLAPPGDVDSLALRISKLLAEPDLASAMGKASSQISQEFCLEKTLDTTETFYHQICARTKPLSSTLKNSMGNTQAAKINHHPDKASVQSRQDISLSQATGVPDCAKHFGECG